MDMNNVMLVYIVLWQGESKTTLILDIDNQNTTCVFASEGIQAACLNFNLERHQSV